MSVHLLEQHRGARASRRAEHDALLRQQLTQRYRRQMGWMLAIVVVVLSATVAVVTKAGGLW